jgi:hypothetical protein
METIRKHEIIVRPGNVDVHLLEPIPTAGLAYDDRDALMVKVRDSMVRAMRELYGVDSPPTRTRAVKSAGEGVPEPTAEMENRTD